jgi:hypothetical protein
MSKLQEALHNNASRPNVVPPSGQSYVRHMKIKKKNNNPLLFIYGTCRLWKTNDIFS